MMAAITQPFVLAVEEGAEALRERADQLMKECEADPTIAGTTVEKACKAGAERYRQTADLLDGWVGRHRYGVGLPLKSPPAQSGGKQVSKETP